MGELVRACATTALTHTGTPRTHPQPHTEHRKYAVIKGRAVQGGSDARRLDDRTDARIAKSISYTKRGLHTSCEPRREGSGHVGTWRERGDNEASERSERAKRARRGGVRALLFHGRRLPDPLAGDGHSLVAAVAKSGIHPQ